MTDGRIKLDANGEPVWSTRPCNTPLFEFNGARRYSIAEYIAKHAAGKFKLLIGDEVHQFKSKSSDRGVAFHQLVTAAKWTLTLTGTFFGGKVQLDLLAAASSEPWRAARFRLS